MSDLSQDFQTGAGRSSATGYSSKISGTYLCCYAIRAAGRFSASAYASASASAYATAATTNQCKKGIYYTRGGSCWGNVYSSYEELVGVETPPPPLLIILRQIHGHE